MKVKSFLSRSLLAGCLAFGVGLAASWLLSQLDSDASAKGHLAADLLPDLVTVTLEEEATPGELDVLHVARYEVTIAHWDQCVAAGGCAYEPPRRQYQSADHPVTGVNWLDAQQYIQWLSKVTGRDFRLPKASEWDYLAKDVVEQEVEKLWDDPRLAWAADYASYGLRQEKTTRPVGHFSTNRHGVHDLDGNVWEWTDTCWRSNETGDPATTTPERCGGTRILSGTHKTYQSVFVRRVPAGGCSIGFPPANIGFRVVLDGEPDEKTNSMLQVLHETSRIPSA